MIDTSSKLINFPPSSLFVYSTNLTCYHTNHHLRAQILVDMAVQDNVYLAKLAEQAERYEGETSTSPIFSRSD